MLRTRTESAMAIMVLLIITFLIFARIPLYHVRALIGEILTVLVLIFTAVVSFREVPAQPPSVAVPTFLGRREVSVVREGFVFVFPGIEDLIVKDFLPFDAAMTFSEVRCLLLPRAENAVKEVSPASGGAVSVKVAIMFVPDIDDPERMIMYLNKGGKQEVARILEMMIGEVVRYEGSRLTWEQFAFSKSKLSAQIISQLTIVNPPPEMTEDQAREFLIRALDNGVADIQDLGIKIRRLNVIEVEPEGHLREYAQHAADELLRRQAENIDVDTLVGLAHKLMEGEKKRGHLLVYKDALEQARIIRGHATETIIRSSGNGILDAAVAYGKAAQPRPQRKGSKKGSSTDGSDAPETDNDNHTHDS
jgi:hypothetical protein